jgi:hypothetical protein
MGPVRNVLRPLILWVQCWPQLAACYLLGLLVRTGAIELAAWAGHDNDWWASLIMPLAGLARLGSYVAMFLVLRRSIPVLASFPRASARRLDLFATVIVPFFAIYLGWKMFAEDWLAFEAAALNYRIGENMARVASGGALSELHPDTLPVGPSTVVLIIAALAGRYVLSWLKDRLPGWLLPFRIYVDALWVFLVLSFSVNKGLTWLINPAGWLAERRIVVWFNTARAGLFSHFQPLETAWDTVMWALRTVFGGAAIPLLWLAIAGIVYGVSLALEWNQVAHRVARRVAGDRAGVLIERAAPTGKRLQTRWQVVPKPLREKTRDRALEQFGKFRPIADSARLVLHGGVVALSLYVLAYLVLAWLDMSGAFYRVQFGDGYLFRGMAWVLGPHSAQFWSAYSTPLSLISHLIIEPLRICLVASTFAYCLQHALNQSPDPAPVTASTEPGSDR